MYLNNNQVTNMILRVRIVLQALSQPDPMYPLTESLPEEVIKEGKLSSLQLEGVLYAVCMHKNSWRWEERLL